MSSSTENGRPSDSEWTEGAASWDARRLACRTA